MDPSFSILLDALRKMESHISEVIDGRGDGLERHEPTFVQRGVVSVFNEEYTGDEGPVFVREPFDDDSDDSPVFDEEPLFGSEPVFDRVATFEFVDEQHTAVYADDAVMHAVDPELCYDDLDDGPIFDEGPFVDPVFNATPDSEYAAATVLNCINSDVLTTACIGFIFDEEPFHDVLDDMASDLCILFDPAHVAYVSSAMNMECSNINIDMPVNCSTKCLSSATDITGSNLTGFDLTTDPILDEEPVYEEESSTGVLFTCSTKCMGHVVGSVAFSTVCHCQGVSP
jgi:hypothetical protein